MLAMKITVKQLVQQAYKEIETISAEQAIKLYESQDVLIVDIRDIRELEREGRIPDSFHAPRGMLEFWADPESPYHHEQLTSDKKLVLHCAKGWRSALGTKTLQDMGMENVCHFDGGFEAWKENGGPFDVV